MPRPSRFNSATAVKPWRTRLIRDGAAYGLGFNSATAVKPWRTSRSKTWGDPVKGLQFGHGGEAVENDVATTGDTLRCELQFGHGGEAVENHRRTTAPGICRDCFNSATAVKPWRTAAGVPRQRDAAELQFGHGGEAVETSASRRWPLSRALQFGHGGEAVETKHQSHGMPTGCSARRSFNSATAVKPWRTHQEKAGASTPQPTSFNSATAVKPWRAQGWQRQQAGGLGPASIRPRR